MAIGNMKTNYPQSISRLKLTFPLFGPTTAFATIRWEREKTIESELMMIKAKVSLYQITDYNAYKNIYFLFLFVFNFRHLGANV